MPNELDDSELRGPRNEGPLLTLMRVPVVKSGTRQEWKSCLSVRKYSHSPLYSRGGGERDINRLWDAESDPT
jgi:hypothetical protein